MIKKRLGSGDVFPYKSREDSIIGSVDRQQVTEYGIVGLFAEVCLMTARDILNLKTHSIGQVTKVFLEGGSAGSKLQDAAMTLPLNDSSDLISDGPPELALVLGFLKRFIVLDGVVESVKFVAECGRTRVAFVAEEFTEGHHPVRRLLTDW